MCDDYIWVPTEEVTQEQMFEWNDEDNERMQEEALEARRTGVFYIPFRRVYVGHISADGSDIERGIWTHGYKMVYWGRSREIVSLCKKEKRLRT